MCERVVIVCDRLDRTCNVDDRNTGAALIGSDGCGWHCVIIGKIGVHVATIGVIVHVERNRKQGFRSESVACKTHFVIFT